MKTVFILGAGASVEAGAPLMRDFIPTAKRLQRQGVFGSDDLQIKDVLNAAYIDLQAVHAKSAIDSLNIEELFSAIDMGQRIQKFGSRPKETIDALRKAIVVFIFRTIEETIRIPHAGAKIGSPVGYGMLAALVLEKLRKTVALGLNEVSFLTFNYDACLEFALTQSGLGVDYCLDQPFVDSTENGRRANVPVLKLHGSINWGFCSKCKAIVPTEINPWRTASFIDIADQRDGLPLPLGTRVAQKNHACGSPLDSVPVIVPPTWNKASASEKLGGVWQRAAKELGSADNVIVIGYSMPVTDTFFKYLFALGSASDVHLEKFVVIDKYDDAEREKRFRQLLGQMNAQGFQSNALIFSGAQAAIRDVLFAE